jgi:outer membrane cobalamin receptor
LVLTGENVRRLPIVSVADALRLIASIDVRSRGPFDVQSDFSFRGAAFGQALVLVDGVRLNDAQSGHHNSDIPVPLEVIERIEVLLGTGSSLHGADATGGTVNIITRPNGRRLLANVAAGQHGLVDASATLGTTRGHIGHVVSGSFSRSDGFMPARDHDVR